MTHPPTITEGTKVFIAGQILHVAEMPNSQFLLTYLESGDCEANWQAKVILWSESCARLPRYSVEWLPIARAEITAAAEAVRELEG